MGLNETRDHKRTLSKIPGISIVFWGVKLTTHLHLVQTSRMHGAIPPFPQYAFMAWCSVKKKAQGQITLLFSYYLVDQSANKIPKQPLYPIG
jgi:hypothetical protein